MFGKYTRLEKRNWPWIYLFLLPTLAVFCMFYIVPILTVIITTFTRWDGFNPPTFSGFTNLQRLFNSDTFLISLRNLFAWVLIAAVIHVGYGVMIALMLHRRPAGWKFVRAVYMVPNVISVAAWAVIYNFVFNDEFGLLNGIIRLVFPNFHVIWFFESPAAFWAITFTWVFYAVIVMLIVNGNLLAIPEELYEAAYIDGASNWQVTRLIKLPLCRNAISTSVIVSITARIGMYEAIRLTSRGGPGDDTSNLPLILVRSIRDMNYGYANAVALTMMVIGILLMLTVTWIFKERD